MWNLLRGAGVGGGSQGENEIANNLSEALDCCVGVMVAWAGATRLGNWNGRLSSASYDAAKAYTIANGGLNKPSVITLVGNLASANYNDDFYLDLNLFKAKLDTDCGAGSWRLILAPMPIVYRGGNPLNFDALRDLLPTLGAGQSVGRTVRGCFSRSRNLRWHTSERRCLE